MIYFMFYISIGFVVSLLTWLVLNDEYEDGGVELSLVVFWPIWVVMAVFCLFLNLWKYLAGYFKCLIFDCIGKDTQR